VGDFFADTFVTVVDGGHGWPTRWRGHKHYELFFSLMEMLAQGSGGKSKRVAG
jgi:hypothetical protein